jgi:hypothetical protein
MLRRSPLWAAVGGLALEGIGATWDIAWHGDIGRDRFLTPPHAMIVSGIAVVALSAAVGVLVGPPRAVGSASGRDGSPGLVLAGAAACLQAAGLAVDNWWHGIFGIDVTLWSPPHLLLLALGYLAVLGLMAESARRAPGRSDRGRVGLAAWAGALMGATTLLLAEYEFGFPHFALAWSAPVMAICLGFGLGLARAASGHRHAGLIAVFTAVGLRLITVAFNAAVHRSLPVPPVGLLVGGLVFDLAVARMPRRLAQWRLPVAAMIGWAGAFPAQAVWSQLAGKTWWPPSVLPAAFGLGLVLAPGAAWLGGRVGLAIASCVTGDLARPPRRPASLPRGAAVRLAAVRLAAAFGTAMFVALVAAAAGTYRPTTIAAALRGQISNDVRPAGFRVEGTSASLWLTDAHPGDWVSVYSIPGRAAHWIGGLTWRGGGHFAGHITVMGGAPAVPRYGFWVVTGNHAWYGDVLILPGGGSSSEFVLATRGPLHWVGGHRPVGPIGPRGVGASQLTLRPASSHPPRPVPGWLTPTAYLLVLAVLAAGGAIAALPIGRP